jgi:hypothetical protein
MRPDILAQQLIKLDLNSSAIVLIQSFLTGRQQCVRYQGINSPYRPTTIGVAQGTLTGPLLWNSFVDSLRPCNELIKYADDTTAYCTMNKTDVNILQRRSNRKVDITTTNNAMQDIADSASNWCKAHAMRLNTQKTKLMLFTLQTEPTMTYPVSINNVAIEQVCNTKLLGVYLDNHLTFSAHVDYTLNKTRSAIHALLTLKRHNIKSELLVLFYKTRILSILSYASSCCIRIWQHTTKRNWRDTNIFVSG